jgi:hypothetical protein
MAGPARATDLLDLKVGLKTLPLLTEKMSGSVPMAVVYGPGNAASKAEAETIVTAVGSGLDAPGGVTVTAIAVPVADLAKHGDAKLVFITTGLGGDWGTIQQGAPSALTLSTDLDCVKADKCIIGVVSQPSVSIYYSKAAADAGKIGFSDAFSMLAKKF